MEKIVVYGIGKFFHENCEYIHEKYSVVGYVDKLQKMDNHDVSINIDDVVNEYDKILIMVLNINVCFEIITCLMNKGIRPDKILLGFALWGKYSSFSNAYVTDEGKICLVKENIRVMISTEDEFNNVVEVLLLECYKYHLNSNKKEVVFDVGMNIGDSTLYFLNQEKVEKVYSFEPFYKTYCDALENLKKYDGVAQLEMFNYGLSDKNAEQEIVYNYNMSCGQSTIENVNSVAVTNYESWGLLDKEDSRKETISVRKSSEVFENIISLHSNTNLVLKLDCEGEEYGIMEDLSVNGLLNKFSFIMLEWHYKSDAPLLSILEENGFSHFSMKKSLVPALGLIYAWKE